MNMNKGNNLGQLDIICVHLSVYNHKADSLSKFIFIYYEIRINLVVQFSKYWILNKNTLIPVHISFIKTMLQLSLER